MTAIFINRTEVPSDFFYFRSSAPACAAQWKSEGFTVDTVADHSVRHRVLHGFESWFYEKIDIEPESNFLRAHGKKHGIAWWTPWRAHLIPRGWRRWPRSLRMTGFEPVYSVSGFSVLDQEYYWNKWEKAARYARSVFLRQQDLVISSVSIPEFLDAYRRADRAAYKEWYVAYFNVLANAAAGSSRQWLVKRRDEVLAGMGVLDHRHISFQGVLFVNQSGRSPQAGTGLIDRWFEESLARGIRYLDFDHVRSERDPMHQRGYTEYKLRFIDFVVSASDIYFKIF